MVSLGGWVLLVVALRLQVGVVEEPYLRTVRGQDYVAYTARVGRFVPGIGRTRAASRPRTRHVGHRD